MGRRAARGESSQSPRGVGGFVERCSHFRICSIKFDQMPEDWKLVFNSLDRKDGHKDGRLHKHSLQNMLNTLETNSTWSLDYKTSQLGDRIKRQISKADKDKNGYLDKEEFADLVERLQQATVTCQVRIKDCLAAPTLSTELNSGGYERR